MLKIKITQEFQNSNQAADALETIATRVRHWLTKWNSPDYVVTSDE